MVQSPPEQNPTTPQPYPACKPSGIPRLGGVPAHWEVRRLKYLLQERDARSSEGKEQLLRVSQYTGVTQRKAVDGKDSTDTRAESLIGYKCVKRDDLVVNIMLAWNGSLGVSPFDGITSPAYCVYQFLADSHPYFCHYMLRSHPYRAYIKSASTGVVDSRLRLYTDNLYQLAIPLPPLAEQTAIVRYLDHADRRIRRYVSAKRRLIALLEEERQAVINHAVTRGLDPNARLKPSGVEWLTEMPEHWDRAQFGRVISIAEGQVDPKVEPYASMLLIAPNHLESSTGRLLGQETASEQGAISGKYYCRTGDVIYTKIRPALSKVFIAPTDCLCSADMYPLRPHKSLQTKYLFWLLLSQEFTAWAVLQSGRVAMPKINRQALNYVHLPMPPAGEQSSIVNHLDKVNTEIDDSIARARRQIELLEEYRTRLIADVVTGKLDVRAAAAQLEAGPEEEETVDGDGFVLDN